MKGFNYFFCYWDNTLQVWIDVKSPRTDKGQADLARKYSYCCQYGKYRGERAPIDNAPPIFLIYKD